MRRRPWIAAVAAVIAVVSVGSVTCTPRESLADEPPRELSVNPWVSLGIIGVGTIAWSGSELAKSSVVATQCRWCQTDGFDASVRDALRWSDSDTATANAISNGFGFVGMPLLLFGGLAAISAKDGAWRKIPEDLLVVVEATILAADLNQAVKFSVQRERPFVHALAPADKGSASQPSDNNLSFYSGHTTMAFSVATSAAMVATLRGYSLAPVLWAVGLPLAAFTGYLRIAADKHYMTDVLVGAALGSAFGIAVPWLHRAQAGRSVVITPFGIGASVVVTM